MPRFPAIAYPELARFLNAHQVFLYRRAKGSHEVWRHAQTGRLTTVVKHGRKTIKRKTLKAILAGVALTVDDIQKWRQP